MPWAAMASLPRLLLPLLSHQLYSNIHPQLLGILPACTFTQKCPCCPTNYKEPPACCLPCAIHTFPHIWQATDRTHRTSLLDSSTSSAPSTPEQTTLPLLTPTHHLWIAALPLSVLFKFHLLILRFSIAVTPEEFVEIVSLSSDYRQYQTPAKLLYLPEACQVIAMAPYPIHEVPIQSFAGRIRYFLDKNSLGADDTPRGHHPVLNFNLAIEDDESPTTIIPDLCLDLHPQFLSPVPTWVMECGFSSTQHHMEAQLRAAADIIPGLDAALTISIREENSSLPPKTHPLHSLPLLPRSAFMPMPPHRYSFGPIVMKDVKWISVASVTFQISLKERDGRIRFGDGPLWAQGQLYPDLDMCKVDELLDLAAQRLLLRAADMEADAGAAPDRVAHLQGLSTTATFPSDWALLLEELQAAVWQTAFSRYRSWRHSGLKRRQEGEEGVSPDLELGSSSKRLASSE
ncbi:hypothetical protein EDC04DRAFT_2616156 [Pisolithus marmoratus]|nr:hypothetical protein EDC04DRAFT_2616156 [Pisolithus marmoratus]